MESEALNAAAQSNRRKVTPPGRNMWLRPWSVQLAPKTVMSDGGRGASSSGAPIFSKFFLSQVLRLSDVVWLQRCPNEN